MPSYGIRIRAALFRRRGDADSKARPDRWNCLGGSADSKHLHLLEPECHDPDTSPDDHQDEKGVLVASSGWEQGGWSLIDNHRALVIDRGTYAIEELIL